MNATGIDVKNASSDTTGRGSRRLGAARVDQFPHKDLSAGHRAAPASRPMRIRRFAAAVVAAATLLGVGGSVISPSPVAAEGHCYDQWC